MVSHDATTPAPRVHRCALCFGRGYRITTRRDGYSRTEPCKRCNGTGQHGDRKVRAKPVAATEL